MKDIREMKYERRGLKHFKLGNLDDVAEILDVYADEVKGYFELSSADKIKFKKFMLNFYNTWGPELRSYIMPVRVYIAEDEEPLYHQRIYMRFDYVRLDGMVSEEWVHVISPDIFY